MADLAHPGAVVGVCWLLARPRSPTEERERGGKSIGYLLLHGTTSTKIERLESRGARTYENRRHTVRRFRMADGMNI